MSKEQSVLIKGIAILMMLWYHLFISQETVDTSKYISILTIGPLTLENYIARACYPVSFFLIISGYGLSYLCQNGKLTLHHQLRKTHRLYLTYWLVLIIFVPIGCYLQPDKYPGSPINIISNLLAIDCTYNGETWFLFPYIMISLTAVYIVKYLLTVRHPLTIVTLIVAYAVCFLICKQLALMEKSLLTIFLLQVVYYVLLFFYFTLGILLYRIASHRGSLTIPWLRQPYIIFLIIVLVMLKSFFKVTLLDGIYAFLFIVFICNLRLSSAITRILTSLGHYSLPMWLSHTFFSVYLFPHFIYGFRYPLLIMITLTAISYLTAVLIFKIMKFIL